MPSETPFPLQGPPPNTLAEVRQHINYWSSRQNEGHLESEWEAWVKNRLDALRWKEQELLMREGPSRSPIDVQPLLCVQTIEGTMPLLLRLPILLNWQQ